MSIVITKDGKERGIREALDYLERAYGIPPGHIRAISVASEVGQPIMVSVTLLWQCEPAPEVTETEVTQFGDTDRVFMRSDGTMRHEPRPPQGPRTVAVPLISNDDATAVFPAARP